MAQKWRQFLRQKLAKIAKIGPNHQKLAKIAENCDHKIDPWTH
jgi:hypothetical protein